MSEFVTNILAGGFLLGITTGLGLLAWTLKKLTTLDKEAATRDTKSCSERKQILDRLDMINGRLSKAEDDIEKLEDA